MKIIQVNLSKGYGGAETHTLSLIQGLLAAGEEVMLLVRPNSWLAKRAQELGIPYQLQKFRGNYDLLALWQLRRFILQWKPDIVHAQLTRAARYVGYACAGTSATAVSTCHATSSHKNMARCAKIIAVSQMVKHCLMDNYDAKCVDVVYNGIAEPELFAREEIRQELGISKEIFALACVGRFVSEKGQDLLINAMHDLPKNVHLYFIGDDANAFGGEVKRSAGDSKQIHFLGFRHDVTRILHGMDALVAPSRREALSVAAIEASAVQLPVIAAKVGGLPEVVSDGETGLLFPVDDVDQLRDAILQLSENKDQRILFGKSARKRFENCFTLDHMTQATLGVYQQALRK